MDRVVWVAAHGTDPYRHHALLVTDRQVRPVLQACAVERRRVAKLQGLAPHGFGPVEGARLDLAAGLQITRPLPGACGRNTKRRAAEEPVRVAIRVRRELRRVCWDVELE